MTFFKFTRLWPVLSGLVTLTGLCAFVLSDQPVPEVKERPNILIIMADDLDSRQLSCYGGQNIKTRHIDALAFAGMKFNQMIASEAMCIPTRASLFTGLYPLKHGAYQNHKPVYGHLKSVNHYLRNLGYRVGLTGKDHMTTPRTVFPFELVKGFEPNCVSATDVYFLDSVKNYISQKDPFCLFIMSNNPHTPWTVGDQNEFNPDHLKLPSHWVDTKKTRADFAKYLAEVRRLDNQVGEVMEMLKASGKDRNTIVIFLGEQGPQFPGGKWTLYDNGQKSSMIVRWPGVVKSSSSSEAIVQYEDITPTLVDIAGGKAIEGLDGRSILKVLTRKSTQHRDFAYGIHNNIPEGPKYAIRSVRDKRYKLLLNLNHTGEYRIKWMMNPNQTNTVWHSWMEKAKTDPQAKILTDRIMHHPALEFYDLVNDPEELNNLSGNPIHQPLIAKFQTKLNAWMKEQEDSGAVIDKPIVNR